MKVTKEDFIEICKKFNSDYKEVHNHLCTLYDQYTVWPNQIKKRIDYYKTQGWLPLDSGNTVSTPETLKGTSTLYDEEGNIKLQWVKTDVNKQKQLEALQDVLESLTDSLPSYPIISPPDKLDDNLFTLYISNDIHFGMLSWDEETTVDWNTNKALKAVEEATSYLVNASPNSKVGIVVDLGDLTESDNFLNKTTKSGNILDVDGRYPKILRAAYESLIKTVLVALHKHELVYFYNVQGNHDNVTSTAIREIMRQTFKDNPRVIIDATSYPIKYHHQGNCLLQFFHGDGMKMKDAGEVMAVDCQSFFSKTKYRFSHAGHNHRDSVYDGRITKVESHRNLPPTNYWAYHMGYRRGIGTMKAITYHQYKGEVSRNTFNLTEDLIKDK